MKYLKFSLSKGILLDTTILLISTYLLLFITSLSKYSLYADEIVEINFIIKLYNFFIQFYIWSTFGKGIRNLFRLQKGNKAIKYRILRDIITLFEHEKEDYYKPVRVNSLQSINYIECKIKVTEKHYQLKSILIKLDHA